MNYKEYNEKDLQSFEYESTIQSDGKIVGVCELGKATIQMINDSNNYSAYKDSWIKTVHGSFYVYNVEPVQEKVNIKLECYDIKYKLDTLYDKEKYTFPMKLKEWRNAIFNNCGVEYDNSDFPNSDLLLSEQPYIEENSSNRDVLKMIAEAGCSLIITDNTDKFYFDWFDNKTEPYLVKDWLELTTEKESTMPINVVILGRGSTEDNVYYPDNIEDQVEFRIDNNYILDPQDTSTSEDKRYDVIQPIYNRIKNFSYLIFKMRSQSIDNKLSIKLGQRIKYKDIWGNELIGYVITKKVNWLGGSLEDDNNYEVTLSSEEIKESSTNISYASSVKNDLLRVERKADKNNGEISDLIEKNSEFSSKITEFSETIDKLSQSVTDIENFEREVSGTSYIYINNAAVGDLLQLVIEGNLGVLYPSNDLYPSDLYPLENYLIVGKSKNSSIEDKRIHLPGFWLDTGDRFIVENNKSRIERNDGSIENLEDIEIELFEGENYIYLENFQNSNINLSAKYIILNSYTNIFASKAEMKNVIEQSAEQTNIELSKKVGDEEIVAKINMSTEKDKDGSYLGISADKLNFKGKEIDLTGDDIIIKSNNFNVDKDGKITATAGKIGGFYLDDYKLYGNHVNGDCDYTSEDITKLKNYLINGTGLTEEEKIFYDVNKDGILNAVDWIQMQNMVSNENKEFSIELNTKYLDKFLNIQDENGSYIVRLGNLGAFFEKMRINKEFSFYPDNENFSLYSAIGTNESDLIINLDNQKTLSQVQINSYDGNTNNSVITFNKNGNITCVSLTQTSQKEKKKNIEKLENVISILDEVDIYKYNFKNESAATKKHIGFVIGDDYKYSKEITSEDNTGVDVYSMVSVLWQIVKEQQKKINKLNDRVDKLGKVINNGI